MKLGNYAGADADLVELQDTYPDSELVAEAYHHRGRATRKAGLLDGAIRNYLSLYHLGVSLEHRLRACLELSQCFHEKGQHDKAAEWITRYLGLAKDQADQNIPAAYLMLGRSESARGNLSEALLAYHHALAAKPVWKDRIEAMLALVDVYIRKQQFVNVIGTLDQLKQEKLAGDHIVRYLMLTSRAYREMGLPRKAASILRNNLPSIDGARWRARLRIELARCQVAIGRLAEARTTLTLAVAKTGADRDGYTAQCELAEVAMKMGETDEVIASATPLMRAPCGPEIRRRAGEVLAAAYVKSGRYDRAAVILAELPATPSGGTVNE